MFIRLVNPTNLKYSHKCFFFQRPEKYLGDIETWNKAEQQLREALLEFGKPFEVPLLVIFPLMFALPCAPGCSASSTFSIVKGSFHYIILPFLIVLAFCSALMPQKDLCDHIYFSLTCQRRNIPFFKLSWMYTLWWSPVIEYNLMMIYFIQMMVGNWLASTYFTLAYMLF
jgi:hypothetical protein